MGAVVRLLALGLLVAGCASAPPEDDAKAPSAPTASDVPAGQRAAGFAAMKQARPREK